MRAIHWKRAWVRIPPWILVGAAVVLLPLMALMARESISRQKRNSTRLLVEKGAALIRSFEAGTRTGMMGLHWGDRQLQNLLSQTARQPDIVFLLVADQHGVVRAHSEVERIGTIHGEELDLPAAARSAEIRWRIVAGEEGGKVLEVYRRFSPTGPRPPGRPFARRLHRSMMLDRRPFFDPEAGRNPELVIFVGLDMTAVELARREDARQTIVTAVVLLLAGFAGIVLLFMTQSYRATRSTLDKVKARSDHLVANIPIGLLAWDDAFRCVACNRAAETILGAGSPAAVGADVRRFLPPDLKHVLNALDGSDSLAPRQIDCELADGRRIPLESSAARVYDPQGRSLGGVLLLRDLTEVRALQQEVAQHQRLAAVGRLAAGVAHEIRNPLSSIKGFATYFRERYRHRPEDLQNAEIMIREADRLNRVVGQLLEFARPVGITRRPTDLKRLIEASLKLVDRQAVQQAVQLETRLPEAMEPVRLDPDRVSQILLNLYLNAIEAMPDGGRLTVDVRWHADTRVVVVRVNDTGAGIVAEDLPHVFDPYYTTKMSGTGLGLAIVHNVVEAHGGSIRIDSRPGQGTAVTVRLPSKEA